MMQGSENKFNTISVESLSTTNAPNISKALVQLENNTNHELNESHNENDLTQISNNNKSSTIDLQPSSKVDFPIISSVLSPSDAAAIFSESIAKDQFHDYHRGSMEFEVESCSKCHSRDSESPSEIDFEIPFDENTSNQTEEPMNELATRIQTMGLEDRANIHELGSIAKTLKHIQGRRPSAEYKQSDLLPIIDEENFSKRVLPESEKENQPPNKRQKFE